MLRKFTILVLSLIVSQLVGLVWSGYSTGGNKTREAIDKRRQRAKKAAALNPLLCEGWSLTGGKVDNHLLYQFCLGGVMLYIAHFDGYENGLPVWYIESINGHARIRGGFPEIHRDLIETGKLSLIPKCSSKSEQIYDIPFMGEPVNPDNFELEYIEF